MRCTFLLCLTFLVGCGDTQKASNAMPAGIADQHESAVSAPQREEWLHGTWELTYDPDKSPTDWLIFAADGTVEVKMADGRVIGGRYALEGSSLTLTINMGFKKISIPLNVSTDRTRISNESGAYYTKLQTSPPEAQDHA